MVNPINILLIEDSTIDRKYIKLAIHKANVNCTIDDVESIDKALEKLKTNIYDLIFLDYILPNTTGLDFLKSIGNTLDTPVIMVTSIGDDMVSSEAIKLGAYDYINKTLLIKEPLDRIITNTLEKHTLIREKRKALEALKESEEKYRTIIHQIPDIIYKIDKLGNFVFVNDSISLLGYTPEELIGEHFSVIIEPENLEMLSRESVLPIYKGKITGDENAPKLFNEQRKGIRRTKNLEIKLLNKNKTAEKKGFYSIINAEGVWEVDKEGKQTSLSGTIGVIRDITEYKIKEQHIIHLNILLNAMKKITKLFNIETDIKVIVANICKYLMKTDFYIDISVALLDEKRKKLIPFEYIGNHKEESWELEPEGFGNGPKCIKSLIAEKKSKVIKCHVQTCGKCEFCAHDFVHQTILIPIYYQKLLIGVIRIWLDLHYQYFDEDLTLLEEISESLASAYGRLRTDKLLSENEEKYRNLVETLNEGIWVVDDNQSTVFVNSRIAELLLYDIDEMMNIPVTHFLDQKSNHILLKHLNRKSNDSKKQIDCTFIRKDGKKMFTLVVISPIKNESEGSHGAIMGVIDITRRKQMEKSLKKTLNDLRRFNRIVVDREIRMIELKKEVNNLLVESGKQRKYFHNDDDYEGDEE